MDFYVGDAEPVRLQINEAVLFAEPVAGSAASIDSDRPPWGELPSLVGSLGCE